MPFNTRIEDWLQVIRGEFHETPDLRVTLDQAETRWDLDHRNAELILETFVDVGFLRRSPDGSYFHPQPHPSAQHIPVGFKHSTASRITGRLSR